MFDISKKGGAEKNADPAMRDAPRPDAGLGRMDAPASRPGSVSREAAVIGPSIHIDGDLRGEEDLIIEGEVSGTVQLKSNSLTIGPQGKVRADVYAHSVYVDGYLEGDLFGSERVSIRKSAQVRGNITSPRVSLEDGAKFKGSIEMDPQAVQAALGSRTPSKPAQQPQAPKATAPGAKPFEAGKDASAVAAKSAG
jgi:cytoskeletal protein CcmA (bactofilin family)